MYVCMVQLLADTLALQSPHTVRDLFEILTSSLIMFTQENFVNQHETTSEVNLELNCHQNPISIPASKDLQLNTLSGYEKQHKATACVFSETSN